MHNQRSKRYNYNAYIKFKNKNDLVFECKNISNSGAFIECSIDMKKGKLLVVEIMDPNTKNFIEVRAKVKWKSTEFATSDTFGLGIEFLFRSSEDEHKIANIIKFIDQIVKQRGVAV